MGAGAAGLAAARQLQQLGYKVKILEARDRIGGRVHTSLALGGSPIDLGASIITGLIGNPLDEPYIQTSCRGKTIGDNAKIYNRQTGDLIDPELDMRMNQFFNDLLDRVAIKGAKAAELEDRSLGLAMEELLSSNISPDERGMLDWFYANLEYACACDLKHLSNKHWDQDDVFDFSGDHLMLIDGYLSMLEPLSKDLDIVFNTEINHIAYSEEGVALSSSNGIIFRADAALVTIPLGVLKDGWVQFDPPLPEEKQESIRKLGYGLLNKIAMCFEETFWDDTVDWIGTVNTDGNRDARGHAYLLWNMQRFSGKPILVALCSGEAGHTLETLDKEKAIDDVLDMLKRIYKLDKKPQPTSTVITSWESDKYARGSYSYVGIGASASDYNELARTLLNRLYFGGEATNRYHPATVAGAYQSGIREAQKIHDFFYPPPTPTEPPSFSIAMAKDEQRRRKNLKRYMNRVKGSHRRGIMRERSSVLGSGNEALKFKYEYMFSKVKETEGPRYQSFAAPAPEPKRRKDRTDRDSFGKQDNWDTNRTRYLKQERQKNRKDDDWGTSSKSSGDWDSPSTKDSWMDSPQQRHSNKGNHRLNKNGRNNLPKGRTNNRRQDSNNSNADWKRPPLFNKRNRDISDEWTTTSKPDDDWGSSTSKSNNDWGAPQQSGDAWGSSNSDWDNTSSSWVNSVSSDWSTDPNTDWNSKSSSNGTKNSGEEQRRNFRTWVANLVVKVLSKHKEIFESTEKFKKASRTYTHKVVDRENGKWEISDKKEKKIKDYIKSEIKRKRSKQRKAL